MDANSPELAAAVNRLVDEYRAQCLWFLRQDFYPASRAERLRALAYIQRHGDRAAFIRASELRRWLSPPSSERSAG
jgi:hypothetical protein